MTTVGHALTGLAIGVLCVPRRFSTLKKAGLLVAFAIIANMPDLPAAGWGHNRYYFSHSLFVTLLILAVLLVIFGWSRRVRTWLGGWPVLLCFAAAWGSHLLLDSFYNHSNGIRIFWPLSYESLSLAIPWFDVLNGWYAWDFHTLQIVVIEALFYGGPLMFCIFLRRRWGSKTHPPAEL
jgi:membrane-bound metal-dependent hydrolase YbcI (DUF457 family)